MRRSRWMALAAILVVCVGMLGATAVTAGAQSSEREAQRDRRGDHRHRDPRRGDRRRRQPDRARTCSRARRTRCRARRSTSTARRAAAVSPGARSWSTSTTRSSTPTRPRNAEITGVRERRRHGRHVGRVPGVGRRDAQLQGLHRRDRPACPTSRSCPPRSSQQCSDQSFPMAPPQVSARHRIEHPQTFQPNVGAGYYYKQKFGKDLHGVYVFGSDSKSARATRRSRAASASIAACQCCKSDQDFDSRGFAPQSAYTPVVQEMKNDGSNYAQAHQGRTRDGAPAQGSDAPGPHRREGLGLHRAAATSKTFLDGRRRRRRRPVRRHAVPARSSTRRSRRPTRCSRTS